MKKILSITLLLCMVLGMMPITASADIVESGTCGENLTWDLDSEGTLTISGTGDMYDYSLDNRSPFYEASRPKFDGDTVIVFNIDKVIINEGVSSIGEYAFEGLYNMTSIDMPDSINSIGERAFSDCKNLKKVTIPDKVTCISRGAFDFCPSLVSVDLPDKLEVIGDLAFSACSKLQSITIPDSVTTIEMWAFFGCSSLESISIPDGITLIDKMTFHGCSSLTSITLPKSITTIEQYAFYDCENLTDVYYKGTEEEFDKINTTVFNDSLLNATIHYVSADVVESGTCGYKLTWELDSEGTLTISGDSIMDNYDLNTKKAPWYDIRQSITKIVIEDGVKSIGDNAFCGCDNLTEVEISNTVTKIGKGAFYSCQTIEDITIPASVSKIADYTFAFCYNLKSITLPYSIKSIGEKAFGYCDSLSDVYYTNDEDAWNLITVDKTNSWLRLADVHYTETENVDGGNCTDTITWEYNTAKTLTIKGTGALSIDPEIGVPWYNYCEEIRTIIIEEGITYIDDYVFIGPFDSLVNLFMPSSLKGAGDDSLMFYAYSHDLYYNGTQEEWNLINFGEWGDVNIQNANFHFIVDRGICGENLTWTIDSDNTLTISGTGTMKFSSGGGVVVPSALPPEYRVPWHSYREKVKKVIIGSGVTSLADYAFNEFVNMYDLILADSVTIFGESAFRGCDELTRFDIPYGVTTLSHSLFSGCTQLKEVSIPDTVTIIDIAAFSGCYHLEEINIPDSVTEIDTAAFSRCGFKEVNISKNVTNIGSGPFADCIALEKINVDENNPNYVSYDGNLFNKDMTVLWQYATGKDDEKYIVPDGAERIYSSAFEGSSIKEVVLPEGLKLIDGKAFYDCDYLEEMSFPESLEEIDGYAFYNCGNLSELNFSEGLKTIGDEAFYNCDSLIKVYLPDGLTTIRWSVFENCDNLTEVRVPDTVEQMGIGVFSRCPSLKKAGVSKIDKWISQHMFAYCTSLESYVIPDNIFYIGSSAFNGCKSLESVVIPKELKSISYNVFDGCPLTDIYYEGSEEDWDSISIDSYNQEIKTATIHYNCIFDSIIDATVKDAEDAFLTEVDLGEDNNAKRLIVDGKELYYSPQRGKYVGLVSGDMLSENKLTDVVIADAAPTSFIYGNTDGEGEVDGADLQAMKLAIKGKSPLTGANFVAGDVNGDGLFDGVDLQAMKLYIKKGKQFPVLK